MIKINTGRGKLCECEICTQKNECPLGVCMNKVLFKLENEYFMEGDFWAFL